MPGFAEQERASETVVHRLRHWVRVKPDDLALAFLAGPMVDEVTYAELDRRARAIAARLQQVTDRPADTRALLVYEPGLAYVAAYLGCLYAGVVAVPTFAPHPVFLQRSRERFAEICRDAAPRFYLSSALFASSVQALHESLASEAPAALIDTTALEVEALADAWQEPALSADGVAFLQYTSGSTSAPKGVVVTHGNLVHNQQAIQPMAYDRPEAVGVSWLPPYHDMGLIGGILQPLYAGGPGYLMSPLEFLQRPVAWLQAISRYRATVSPLPNFALELCLRKVSDEQIAGLDLSSWRYAINGAEPVQRRTLERFTERFAPADFRAETHKPVYGLAEATLLVSGTYEPVPPRYVEVSQAALQERRVADPASAGDARSLVSCGGSIHGQELRIVDPDSYEPLAEDAIGEIWIRGPSVARGYWGKPEATAETFGATLAGDPDTTWLRTGDLGFLRDGDLFIAGRIKDLIIVEGKNYYPQDIERAAEASHPAVRPGSSAAFGVEHEGTETVVLVAEARPDRAPDLHTLRSEVRRAVRAAVGIDLHELVLIQPRTLPKTSSGKVRRFKSKRAWLDDALAPLEEGT